MENAQMKNAVATASMILNTTEENHCATARYIGSLAGRMWKNVGPLWRRLKMNKEELKQAKAAMKEVIAAMTPEEIVELKKAYLMELMFGKKKFC